MECDVVSNLVWFFPQLRVVLVICTPRPTSHLQVKA